MALECGGCTVSYELTRCGSTPCGATMRWLADNPKHGDRRVWSFFTLWPQKIDNEWVWLEWVYSKQIYKEQSSPWGPVKGWHHIKYVSESCWFADQEK